MKELVPFIYLTIAPFIICIGYYKVWSFENRRTKKLQEDYFNEQLRHSNQLN